MGGESDGRSRRVWWAAAAAVLVACGSPPSPAGDTGGDDGDLDTDDGAIPDVALVPSPSVEHFGAGDRLAPIVWETPQGLREHGSFPRGQVAPTSQAVRDLTEDWYDHELEFACSFAVSDTGYCLPRRAVLAPTGGFGGAPAYYADPNCEHRVLLTTDGQSGPYARRLSDDQSRTLAVARLGPPELSSVYQLGFECQQSGVLEHQRVGADVPLSTFVRAEVDIDTDPGARVVPVTMRTEDGAWRHVDMWDTELSTRLDPTDDVRDPWRWLPAVDTSASQSADEDWDAPPRWGPDAIARADLVYEDPGCEASPMLRTSNSDGTWYIQTQSSVRLPELGHRGPPRHGVPAYGRNSTGGCHLLTASCDNCFERLESRPVTRFPVAERAITTGERLHRYDWIDARGHVVGPADPPRWYDRELDIDCSRSQSGEDFNFYCFPFPPTRSIYEDEQCTQKFGELLDGRDSTPPPFVSSSAFLTTLLQVQWVEIQPGTRVFVSDCTNGCTCFPHEVNGPRAYYYDGIGGNTSPSQLVRFDRRILPPR